MPVLSLGKECHQTQLFRLGFYNDKLLISSFSLMNPLVAVIVLPR